MPSTSWLHIFLLHLAPNSSSMLLDPFSCSRMLTGRYRVPYFSKISGTICSLRDIWVGNKKEGEREGWWWGEDEKETEGNGEKGERERILSQIVCRR